ncbi:methyltransferase domain-containing protein [Tropicimonas sp. IMCC34043]|uniref:class I SAM-dependent methyltransferase n=1 Tax=Tropicimonas sp. IMCC34043 TaxID=2248760 RepID=UPI000E24D01A|nr:methyltransferase domain-containing protein [Tropicimonas sp. IMCC34043]
MHLDVLDLRNFYYKTRLGRVAQRAIREQLVRFWPPAESRGQTVVGFGFAVPLLRPYLAESRRVVALMPAPQGVMPWPGGRPNISALCEEMQWPLDTGSVDRLVLMHGLDTTDHPGAVLEECYRVLGPGGRLTVVVPNRSGLWARRDVTPFGYGRPYSVGQLEEQLLRQNFRLERHGAALYGPPSTRRFWLRSSGLWENVGRKVTSLAGGVLMVEFTKTQQTPRGTTVRESARYPLRILEGIPSPGGEPAGV